MRAFLLLILWLYTTLALGQDTASSALPKVSSGRIERLADFDSKHVPARNIDIWLPQGYPDAGKYAVLYMHDGQMLFDAQQTWNHQEWRADETAATLIGNAEVPPFILVGIWNAGAARHSEYFPQKPYASLSREQRRALDQLAREAKTPRSARKVYSDRYLKFIVHELKPYIDQHYAVHRSAEHTFIMGSSMGALISMYALAEYPKVFGGAACLSTHWPVTYSVDDNPIPNAIMQYMAAYLPPAKVHRLYFDHGTATLDAMYPKLQARVDAMMRSKDYPPNLWQTRVFPGAEHSENAWGERLHIPMRFLMAPISDAVIDGDGSEKRAPRKPR